LACSDIGVDATGDGIASDVMIYPAMDERRDAS
jgi:hypothetical protein